MKKVLLIALTLLGKSLWAQNVLMNTTRDQLNTSGLVIPTNGTIWGLPSGAKGEVLGSPYLDTLWMQGGLKLYQSLQPVGGKPVDTLSGLAMRYNVQVDEIEILLNSYKDIKALQGGMVRSFSLNRPEGTDLFINSREFKGEKLSAGFLQIRVPGRLPLALFHKIVVKKPTYNVAFDTGNKDTSLLPDTDLYVVQQGRAVRFKATRKNILDLMADQDDAIRAYLKTKDPDLKKLDEVVRLFGYYNSL